MAGEAEMMKQIDRLLSVRDGLGDRASEDDNVVDVHRQPDAEATEMPNRWSQRSLVDSRGAGARPKGMPMHSYFTPSHMNRMDLLSCWRRRK